MFQKLGSKILTGKGLGLLGGAGAAAFAGTRCVNFVLLVIADLKRTLFRNQKNTFIKSSRVFILSFLENTFIYHQLIYIDIFVRFGVGQIRLMAESSEAASNFYQFKARDIDGKEVDLSR